MKFKIILLLFLLLNNCAQIQSNIKSWNTTDTLLCATMVGVHYVDYRQTRKIAKNPDKWCEKNYLMNDHPSIGEVNTFFAITTLGKIATGLFLPKTLRRVWLGGNIGMSLYCINNNISLGIDIPF